jgi:chromosome segregation ATPase
MFNTIQETVAALTQEAVEGKNKIKELLSQVNFLKKKLISSNETNTSFLTSLRNEVLASFKAVKLQHEKAKNNIMNLSDEVRKSQLAKEEEIGKTLILEEQLSRMEHEAINSQRKIVQLEKDNSMHSDKHSNLADKLTEEKNFLEMKIKDLKKVLDESNSKLDNYESKIRNLESIISDLTAKQVMSKKDYDSKLNQIAPQVSKLTIERDNEIEKKKNIEEINQHLLSELKALKDANNTAYLQLEKVRKENQEIIQKQQQAMSTVGGTTQQYHNQIKQTQELLKVIIIKLAFPYFFIINFRYYLLGRSNSKD